MNSTLMGIAIAIAVALTVALVAPFLIDWSAYRGYVESRVGDILGRQVRIAGEMDLRLLPQPVLRARQVVAGDGETADITIEQLDLAMSLTPLLSGEIAITEASIRNPFIHLSIDDSGRLTLGDGGRFPVNPDDVSLDSVELTGGVIVVDDARSGRETRFEQVGLTGSAASLLGPFRATGTAMLDGVVHTVSLQSGRITPEHSLRVKLGVIPADRPVTFHSDGLLSIEDGAPVFTGQIRLERFSVEAGQRQKGGVWRIDADVRATAGSVEAAKARLGFGDPESGIALEGEGRMVLGEDARLVAHLSARQIDLDRHLGDGDAGIASLAARLSERIAGMNVPFPLEAELDVGAVVAGHVLFEDLSAAFSGEGTAWRIDRLRVDGPGDARLALTGNVDIGGPALSFEGHAAVQARNGAAAMLALAGRGDIPGIGRLEGPVTAEAAVTLSPDRLAVSGLDVAHGGTRIGGDLQLARSEQGRRRLTLDIEAERLHAEGLGALFARLAGGDAGLDIEARLNAASVVSGQADIGALSIDTRYDGRRFALDRFSLSGAEGTRIEGGGALEMIEGRPAGGISVDVEAGTLGGLAALAEAFGRPEAAAALLRGEGLTPLKLAFRLDGARAEGGAELAVSASGTAAGGPVRLEGRLAGEVSAWRAADVALTLEAQNGDAAALLALAGIDMTLPEAAAGQLSLRLAGKPATGLDTSGRFEGAGLALDFSGRTIIGEKDVVLDGVDIAASADDPVLAAAGLGIPAPGGAGAGPARLAGTLGGSLRQLSLQRIEGDWQGNGFIGYLDLDRRGERPALRGQLRIGEGELGTIGALLFGEGAFSGGRPWPQTVIPSSLVLPFDLDLDLSARGLLLPGGFRVVDAGFSLAADGRGARLKDLRGTVNGGNLAGALSLMPGADGAVLEASLRLDGARLEEASWRRQGRPVASGGTDLTLVAGGGGRTLAGIVANLAGSGSFAIRQGRFNGLNPAAFDAVVVAADAGLPLDEARIREVFAAHLASGSLDFSDIEGAFSIAGGVVRAERVTIDAGAADSFLTGRIDLNDLSVDATVAISTASKADADGGRQREAALVFSGPLDAPQRHIDVAAFMGYLTVREFEREVDRLESLQADINEQQFFSRQLLRQGEERRRREREAAEAARRAAEEARREQAREAEARKAEEARRAAAEKAQQEQAPPAGNPVPSELEKAIQDALREPPSAGAPISILPPAGPASPPRSDSIERAPLGEPLRLAPPSPGAGGR